MMSEAHRKAEADRFDREMALREAYSDMLDAWEAYCAKARAFHEMNRPPEEVVVAKRLAAMGPAVSPGFGGQHNTMAVWHAGEHVPVDGGTLELVWQRYLGDARRALEAVNGREFVHSSDPTALPVAPPLAVPQSEAAHGVGVRLKATGVGVRLKGGSGVRMKAGAAPAG